MNDIPFVKLLIPYIIGIIVSYRIASIEVLWYSTSSAVLLFMYLCIINVSYLKLNAYRFKSTNGLVFHFFWFAFGVCCCVFHNQAIKADHFTGSGLQYLRIRIADEPQQKSNIIRSKCLVINSYKYIEPDHPDQKKILIAKTVSGKLMVAIKIDPLNPAEFGYGDEFIIRAQIKETESPHNPSEFDYKAWLAIQNIYHQTFLKQKDLIRVKSNAGNPIIAFALKLRTEQINFYRRILKSDDAFSFASTLILGYKSDLSPETLNIYSKTGTIHALSVSGMHVGIVYAVLNLLLRFLDRKRWLMAIKVSLILSFIWFYTLLTGLSPSVLRSAIMISVFIIAKSFVKNTNSYNIIAFAAFCLLVYTPFLIWDVGFQLSFLAVLGLIWLQPKIENWWYIENKWLGKLWSTVAISLAAQLITCPLSVYYFHQFPVYFLISNLFIVIPVALLMYLGILILLFRIVMLAPVLEWLISFTNAGLSCIAKLPWATISGIWITKLELIVVSIGGCLLVLALSYYKKQWLYAALLFILSFEVLLFRDILIAAKQRTLITFKIRNQITRGIISGHRATLITQEKPDEHLFNYFIKPALDQHKVKNINWVIINRD